VHHLIARAKGGKHTPTTLAALCSAHHAAAHDGRMRVEGTAPGKLRFTHADGRPYGEPPPRMRGEPPAAAAVSPAAAAASHVGGSPAAAAAVSTPAVAPSHVGRKDAVTPSQVGHEGRASPDTSGEPLEAPRRAGDKGRTPRAARRPRRVQAPGAKKTRGGAKRRRPPGKRPRGGD